MNLRPSIPNEASDWIIWLDSPKLGLDEPGWLINDGDVYEVCEYEAAQIGGSSYFLGRGKSALNEAILIDADTVLLVLSGAAYFVSRSHVRAIPPDYLGFHSLLQGGHCLGDRCYWVLFGEYKVIVLLSDLSILELKAKGTEIESVTCEGVVVRVVSRSAEMEAPEVEAFDLSELLKEFPKSLREEDLSVAQEAFQSLVGQPLTAMWRYAGHQALEFGPRRQVIQKGRFVRRADIKISLNGEWWIERDGAPVLSWDDFGNRRRDTENNPVYERLDKDHLVVTSASIGKAGELLISMTNGFTLRTGPWSMTGIWRVPTEHWYLFLPKLTVALHEDGLVVTPKA